MNLEFAIHVITTLLMFKPTTSQTCNVANWWTSLDRQGWSVCPKINTYLIGFMRSGWLLGDERVGRLEEGRCCEASEPIYAIQPAACSNANWASTLNGFNVWALCPAGYYLNGLRLGRGPPGFLSDIEEGKCCRPQNHPNRYEDCYDEDVSSSFDTRGWSECQRAGYYMTGFYKSNCNDLNCIDKFRCCKMNKGLRSGAVHGGWSDFGDWSECSVPCGGGIKERRRTCTSPPPANGGRCCAGDNVEAQSCNSEPCGGEKVKMPDIHIHHVFANLHTKAKIRCDFEGQPIIKVTWKKAGKKGSSSSLDPERIRLEGNTLYFEPVEMEDEGQYFCKGENSFSSAESYVNFSVIAYPTFLVRPKNTTAYVNDDLWLHCIATGNPKPKISWSKDEQGGDKLDEERFIKHSNGTLHIKNVRLEDQGGYYCIAANRDRLRQSKFSLVVQRPVCPQGWVLQGNSCFLIIDTPTVHRNEAGKKCQQLGGDLAKIKSATENQFIFDLLRKQNTITLYGVWLGLHRKADTKFYWADDTPLTGYTAWGANEPSGLYEKCGHMIGYGPRGGKWNDIRCTFPAAFHPSTAPVILCQKGRYFPNISGN